MAKEIYFKQYTKYKNGRTTKNSYFRIDKDSKITSISMSTRRVTFPKNVTFMSETATLISKETFDKLHESMTKIR